MRRQHLGVLPLNTQNIHSDDGKKNSQKSSIHSVPIYTAILVVIHLVLVYGCVYLIDGNLPVATTLKDEETNPDAFISERAMQDLKKLTDLGPRLTGSYENEHLTVELLTQTIETIMKQTKSGQQIELDVQNVSGAFYLNAKPYGRFIVYSNLQNIIVKIHAEHESAYNVLVNAHFDTVPTSPGGSDDGISCAAMLEIIRKMAALEQRPTHPILFLFNGAEEVGIIASHGFIVQHKWATASGVNGTVLVNLEAGGSGGKMVLFQSGPVAPWLFDFYAKVPYPQAQTAAEEIFQWGLIPSDTDFRIFRDYAKNTLVGYDFAFYRDSYRYHTQYDNYANIPHGSMQHIGANSLKLIRDLSGADFHTYFHAKNQAQVVFFDYLGLFMFSYTVTTANFINYTISIVSLATFFATLYVMCRNFEFSSLLMILVKIFALICGGWFLALLFVVIFALFIDYIGYSMRWYGNPLLLFGLFVAPSIAMQAILIPKNLNDNVKSHLQASVIRIIFTVLLFTGTLLKIRLVYVILPTVLFNTIAFILIYLTGVQHTVRLWKVLYIFFATIASTLPMYSSLVTLTLFVPISGRFGPDKNVDLIIGGMTLIFTILITSPFVALANLIRKLRYFIALLFVIFLATFFFAISPAGFPYSVANLENVTPQRFWIIHTTRSFNGSTHDSGYYILNLDRNSPNTVVPYVKEFENSRNLIRDCEQYLVCGSPLAHPKMIQILKYATWIPAGEPSITSEKLELKILEKTKLERNLWRYEIQINGPDRVGVYLSPNKRNNITRISLVDEMPSLQNTVIINERPVYFILHVSGKSVSPLKFSFDVQKAEDENEVTTTEIAISAVYVHPKRNVLTEDFKKFLGQFPDWAEISAWLGAYESVWI